jgi:CspA family cold shock protein
MFGSVRRYYGDRGFGFLEPDGGGEDVFFHVKAFISKVEPAVGDRVEYELGNDPRSGRERAINLRMLPQAARNTYRDVA